MGVTCCNGSSELDQIENFTNKLIQPTNYYILDEITHIPEEGLISSQNNKNSNTNSLSYSNKLEEFKRENNIPDKAFHLRVYASYDENIFPIWVEKGSTITMYVYGTWYLFDGQVEINSLGDSSQSQKIMNFPLGSLLAHVQGGKCFEVENNIQVTSNVSGYLLFLQNNGNFETRPHGFLDVYVIGGKIYKPLELERLSGWNYNIIDTVDTAGYLQDKEKELVILLNKLRTNPIKFATKYLTHLRDMSEYHERAYDELILIGKYMNDQGNNENNSVNMNDNEYTNNNSSKNNNNVNKLDIERVLKSDYQIYKIAQKHASDLNKTGSTGHVSVEGLVLEERLKAKNIDTNCFSEVCSFGKSCPIGILLQLLIDDDDVDNSQNRDTLINGNFSHIGISIQKHKTYGSSCVITLVKL